MSGRSWCGANVTVMDETFHYVVDGQSVGPVGTEQLASMIRAGQLRSDTLVWRSGEPEWRAANTFAELAVPVDVGVIPPLPVQVPPSQVDRYLLPTGRSGMAIAAGYLALFGLVMPPLALLSGIFGWLGLRQIDRSQDTSKPLLGRGRAWFGIIVFVLWVCAIIALAIWGLLADSN